MNTATVFVWWICLILLALLWVVAVDWCVVGIIRAWRHRKITARMHDVLNGRI